MCIYNNANTRQFERTIISYTISIQVIVPPSWAPLLPNGLLKMNHNGKALSPLMRVTYVAAIASTQKIYKLHIQIHTMCMQETRAYEDK